MPLADPSTIWLDLSSVCPGFSRGRLVFVKADDHDLRQFFEYPSLFPQIYQANEFILNNLTLLFKAHHWFIELLGSRRHSKIVVATLGYSRLYARFSSIFDKFLTNRKLYLASNECPQFLLNAKPTQVYMLRIIDDTLKFGRVGSLLGANYRLADCKERWQDFLKELKATGDMTVGYSDSDWTSGSEEESDLGRASSPGDPASGPDPGPGWEVEPATPKATRNRLVPGAGILAFADGLAVNLPMMLRLVREFEEADEQWRRCGGLRSR
ncbi:hypothetical protein QC762_116505 [Podospora pseudocomata]|uniref:Uncharacterized protein n=1 Tax=Podospora pseudocomata TaxID=2093779 RepID=A0ABR0GWK7_9PEZI|nr:hypothetical protein QC762_116505 [Podospora pseudocomata]